MKKIASLLVLGALVGFGANSVMAADACAGTAGNGTPVQGKTDGTAFVRVGFTPKCSANVLAQYADGQTRFDVASGSTKGKSTFMGSTVGGGVTKAGDCDSTGCKDNVAAALTKAKALTESTSTGGGT